eukprot:CAMPEP_0168511968 /NCGR_PEP_ID=MMETSP0405-20121227/2482_1 /TAXON_ID=498012 /ORGANISM="Trichosphaerium sp, Strain Am-I-7 wt" /LENGTH=116 /DNA_ID=CAMNT_0008530309 /DNA_START=310 /DNA_END=657 /DNA_ORIENTATION=-
MSDEMWLGVTNDSEALQKVETWRIDTHPNTIAYVDNAGRNTFDYLGKGIREDRKVVPTYNSGDKIGVLMDLEKREVAFYFNGTEVGRLTLPLKKQDEKWNFFALTDQESDCIELVC